MKRGKPDDQPQSSSDINAAGPSKRFNQSPHFPQPTSRMPPSYAQYVGQGQSYMYGSGGGSGSNVPQQWQYQQHPSLVFDPTQPPPAFPPSDRRNAQGQQLNVSQNNMMHHHQMRNRGRGRGGFRGGMNFDRGGRMRNSHTPNIQGPLSAKSPQLYNKNGQNSPRIDSGDNDDNQTQINKKSKRKPMSTRYTRAKEWDREDALKALALEKEYNRLQRTPMLILKFPDPELNKYIVKKYSSFIETVHFQQPSTPRYCFVQLKEGSDIDKVREELSDIPFGNGKITAERKFQNTEEGQAVTPEEIDPYTLYIGNLPTQISVKTVKEHFPKAARIDIGYAQRMKYTRYAFIRYNSVDDAMEAYKKTFNTLVANRSLIVRFRRAKGNIGLPGESKAPNPKKVPTPKPPETAAVVKETTEAETETETETPAEPPPEEPNKVDPKPNVTVPEDSKANVFKDAERLAASASMRQDGGEDEDDDGLPVNSILGTRIKDEPIDDDELLAQAQCYDDDMDDDDFDCEPEEEDDILDTDYDRSSGRSLLKPQLKSSQLLLNWEEIRQAELNREENKPKLETLIPYVFGTKSSDSLSNAFSVKEKEKEKPASTEDQDDLDELFGNMNPEEEDSDFHF